MVTIEDEIGFNLNSESVAANPQFTLTCVSTGGPATTVTWTRDFENVPGEVMTELINAVTAQYTHTLTVIGRFGGLYACTVSNSISTANTSTIMVDGK